MNPLTKEQLEHLIATLNKASQLANFCYDMDFELVAINGEMVDPSTLEDEFDLARDNLTVLLP